MIFLYSVNLINVFKPVYLLYIDCTISLTCRYVSTWYIVTILCIMLLLKSGLKHTTYSGVMHSLSTQDTKSPSLPMMSLRFKAPKHL